MSADSKDARSSNAGADEGADRRRAVRVGAAVVVAAVVLGGILIATGPLQVMNGKRVRVDFAFAGPIKPGASVRIAGVVVGVVEGVDFLGGQDPEAGESALVRVRARVEDRAAHLLTDKSRFYVTTLGVLGEHYLDIAPVKGGVALADGARVDGVTLPRPDLLLPRAAGLLERADALLPQAPELLGLVQALTSLVTKLDGVLAHTDDGQAPELTQLKADVLSLVHGLAQGIGDGAELRGSLERLPPVLDETRALEQELAAVFKKTDVVTLAATTQRALVQVEETLTLLRAGPVGDPVRQDRLVRRLEETLTSLDAVAKSADGLVGDVVQQKGAAKLLYDDQAAADLKAILRDLRQSPLRFLLSPKSKDDEPTTPPRP
jgi:hypothetical protein